MSYRFFENDNLAADAFERLWNAKHGTRMSKGGKRARVCVCVV